MLRAGVRAYLQIIEMKLQLLRLLLQLILSCSSSYLVGQTIEEQMTKSHPNCKTIFMNAMDMLPKLYRAKSFDSLDKAVDIWESSCGGQAEVRITRILLDMEEDKFSMSRDIDVATINLLFEYASYFPSPGEMQGSPPHGGSIISFYQFSSAWANLLLKNKKLDSNEIFICKIITGAINDPRKEIKHSPQTYPEFTSILEKVFESKRKGLRTDVAFSTGVWLPTNNLSTLGAHPSFGIEFGMRNRRHQFDLNLQFRYLHSASPYAVQRDGHLDSTDYYFGGYIGLDYNYYLVSKTRYEFGILAGMGYDGFDFAPEPYDYYYPYYYTSHVTIGSFNANAGLRFNYFFSHSFYLGLQGRYNIIDYYSRGGTDLSGNAFSLDLIFGFNGSSKQIRY